MTYFPWYGIHMEYILLLHELLHTFLIVFSAACNPMHVYLGFFVFFVFFFLEMASVSRISISSVSWIALTYIYLFSISYQMELCKQVYFVSFSFWTRRCFGSIFWLVMPSCNLIRHGNFTPMGVFKSLHPSLIEIIRLGTVCTPPPSWYRNRYFLKYLCQRWF